MKRNIIMITAGEWPSTKSLLVSQVLETSQVLQRRGYKVSIYAAIPLLSYLKRLFLNINDLKEVVNLCKERGISFQYSIIPVTLGSPYSFLIRKFFHKRIAAKIVATVTDNFDETILHGRSYYAAEIAVLAKEMLVEQKKSHIISSFDMRSILPNEVAIEFGTLGVASLGFFKIAEFNLLKQADVSFLPLDFARAQYHQEMGVIVQYAPIQGLEREANWELSFEKRWNNKKIGYSGSIGQWHDPKLLIDVFENYKDFKPSLAILNHPLLDKYECRYYSQDELVAYYDSLTALVIPGVIDTSEYLITSKFRYNAFSTKGSEALSRGVPLIVSSGLYELAQFVIKNQCGIVFDIKDGKAVFDQNSLAMDKEGWCQLSINAAEIGKQFTRGHAIDHYEQAWNKEFEKRKLC